MMLSSGLGQNARMGDPARTAADERRAFSRRIDCDDTGQARRAVNPSVTGRAARDAQQEQRARRRLDID